MTHLLAFFSAYFGVCLVLAACAPQVSTPGTLEADEVRLEPYFNGLTQPTDLRFLEGGRALASEQTGRIVLLGDAEPRTILDLRERVGCCGERGLLSLAVPPDFARTGLLFFYAADKAGGTTLSRVRLDPKTLEADASTLKILLRIAQPGPTHNGGQLQFGPDGRLYLSTGDGEYRPSWLGPLPHAQETNKLLGKLLRFDVSTAGTLSVPKDNPFVSAPNAEGAVWALGLRNPWRFSFDQSTGDLYLADVGETKFEEVSVTALAAASGVNYGWPRAEGPECRQESCAAFTMPALSYTHDEGCSVTGGYVYRGQAVPGLTGRYLYGDFCTGTLWAAAQKKGRWQIQTLLETPLVISSFAQDLAGEVYVLDYAAGTVYRLVAAE